MRFYRNNLFLVLSVSREYHNGISLAKLRLTMLSHIENAIALPKRSRDYALGIAVTQAKKHLFPNHLLQLVAFFTVVVRFGASLHRDFVQADILDGGPDDRQTTGLGGEHINLIGALTHIAEQTLNGIGGLNVSVHGGRKGIKAQEVIFILSQAADCLWIALRVFGW